MAKYWEGTGAIVRRGLIDEDLFFDRFRGVSSEWGRASEILLGAPRKYDPASP